MYNFIIRYIFFAYFGAYRMVIIDFSDTTEQAFVRGFSKGITAPSMLFEKFTAPPLKTIEQIAYPDTTEAQALNDDWKKIGDDFHHVIEKYGQESDTKK